MDMSVASLGFLVAALCATVMGYAIQRGATCAVAAVEELATLGTARRLASLLEASLWVAGGLVVAQALGFANVMPAAHTVGPSTLFGGVLLGLGAFVNRACVFGAIARLGSGEWAYLLMPPGFYLGCLATGTAFAPAEPGVLWQGSPLLSASIWLATPFLCFASWRMAGHVRVIRGGVGQAPLRARIAAQLWTPHSATMVIAVAFVIMLLAVGAWAYTDVLAELARGMAGNLPLRMTLLLALFMGAVAGGWSTSRFRMSRMRTVDVTRCLSGGFLMGWGSTLIPGGNDGLILVGVPLLHPHAWMAFFIMCLTIYGAIRISVRMPACAR